MTPTHYLLREQPIPTEHEEQCALIDWFDLQYPALRGRLAAVPNGGERNAIVGAKLKAEGVREGYLDLQLLVARNGYHGLLIEMKRRKGKGATKKQKDWVQWHTEQGYLAVVCRGWVVAKAVIEGYLR